MDAVPKEPLMTVREVASYLQMDERYLYRLVASGAIPHYRVAARTIRFKRSEIEAWMEKVDPEKPAGMAGDRTPDA